MHSLKTGDTPPYILPPPPPSAEIYEQSLSELEKRTLGSPSQTPTPTQACLVPRDAWLAYQTKAISTIQEGATLSPFMYEPYLVQEHLAHIPDESCLYNSVGRRHWLFVNRVQYVALFIAWQSSFPSLLVVCLHTPNQWMFVNVLFLIKNS